MTREELAKWNQILHPEYPVVELGAEWLWTEFGIKSAPKFDNECWSHVPECWGDDLKQLIPAIKDKYPDVQFLQIKEKYCSLTIYFSSSPHDRESIDVMIEKCQDVLRRKGLHP